MFNSLQEFFLNFCNLRNIAYVRVCFLATCSVVMECEVKVDIEFPNCDP